jgi:hypothetical protein
MKIQEDSKVGDWFEEWYKKLVQQRLGAIYVTQITMMVARKVN